MRDKKGKLISREEAQELMLPSPVINPGSPTPRASYKRKPGDGE